ncbi:MAG: glutamine-hydrolyzing GMP synthase [Deltaproteobacteria bacterium]|jgi:GMP synthase (glutamine-hydrolysing)|nr:glutamine-hydrolyzing GMP synthase [Deltaproteobacteria bacterium]
MTGHVLIIDYGSQVTQLIARKTRALGYYAEILPAGLPVEGPLAQKPGALILSGGPASVDEPGAPALDPGLLEAGIPVLGICYGMQLLAKALGGRLTREAHGEYGPAELTATGESPLWKSLNGSSSLRVWMSHGDRVETPPPGFAVTGRTPDLPVAAMEDRERLIFGLQFHPEVHHTEKGTELLKAFLEVAGLPDGWKMSSFARDAVESIRETVGPDGKVLCGLSGGVDSTVCAALLARAIGPRLHCVFVDNGLLRLDEAEEVSSSFRKLYPDLDLTVADAGDEFLAKLEGVSDPEKKRLAIGHTFIDVFKREARKLGKLDFLAQGTLYPDVIESISPQGPSALIKSHHNVGGLPAELGFTLIEPLKFLFKDEVRELGAELGVPDELLWRHPFPGPGLAIRIIGPVDRESLALLRKADAVVREELRTFGLDRSVWQAFAVLLNVRSVGVMGDGRSYGRAVAVRAVTSVDAMTADWARLPDDLLARFSSRIINEVQGINRVLYDISPKPPSTIEWE